MNQSKSKVVVRVSGQDNISWAKDETVQQKCCFALTKLIADCKKLQGEDPTSWVEPSGNTHADVILRLFIRKSKGDYVDPYIHEELCHCRSVPTEVIIKAIVNGANTVETIAQWTTAGTACGTCRVDSQKILDSLLVSNN